MSRFAFGFSGPPCFFGTVAHLSSVEEKVHREKSLKVLILSADTTFRVEIDGWVWCLLTIPLYRKLDSGKLGAYWRKSGLPVMAIRHHIEDTSCYDEGFRVCKEEAARRGLPALGQIHSDYFSGLEQIAEKHAAVTITDLEHLWKNLRKKANPKPNRPMSHVKQMLAACAMLPTWALFHTIVETFFARMKFVWRSVRFEEYVRRVYLRKKKCISEKRLV